MSWSVLLESRFELLLENRLQLIDCDSLCLAVEVLQLLEEPLVVAEARVRLQPGDLRGVKWI